MRIFLLLLLLPFALGAPSLAHADAPTQLQLNDAAVLEDICTLFEAERAYRNYDHILFPSLVIHVYTNDINALINENFLPPSWATANPLTRNGYVFQFDPQYPNDSFETYEQYGIIAVPIVPGVTGSWNLYGDWRQTIRLGSDETGALFNYSPCDIAKDITENEAQVIEDLYAVSIALAIDSLGRGYEVDFDGYQRKQTTQNPPLFGQWWDGDRRRNGYVYSYRGEGLDAGVACPNCRYSMVAVPEHFGITGNRAFYLDQSGIIRAENNRNAGPASPPITDNTTFPPNLLADSFRNELAVINTNACKIHQAEVDYRAAKFVYTANFDDMTTFVPPYLEGNWTGVVDGYNYILSSSTSDSYNVTVDPNVQGISGDKGYFFDESGVLRAIVGPGASASSPAIGNVCDEIIKLNPTPPAVTPPALYHSGDVVKDYNFSLSELLRFIQFYNVGNISCSPGSEDGYAAGAGNTSCSPYIGDYSPQDWVISLGELLRLIQLYNSYGYFPCPNPTEDGYCPIL